MLRSDVEQSRASCFSASSRASQSQDDADDDTVSLKSHSKWQEKRCPLDASSTYESHPRDLKMRSSFINGLLAFNWLVHLSALGFTVAECVINFKGWYVADELDRKSGIIPMLNMKQSQDVLQFVAKLHEILILSSLSILALHVARRMLVGDGLPVGLLTGVHQFGSVSWLFSWAFLKPLITPRRARNCFFAIALCLGVVYAAVVGPASAIVLLPSLDWYGLNSRSGNSSVPEHASFIMTPVAEYGDAPPDPLDFMHPASLNKDTPWLLSCLDRGSRTPLCPTVGFETIGRAMSHLEMTGQLLPAIMQTDWGPAARALVSTPEFSQYGESFVAVASTLPEVVTELVGVYAQYFEKMADSASQSARYRYSPEQTVFAPLVQVQCTPFLSSRLSSNSSNAQERGAYHADGLRNLDMLDHEGKPASYNHSWRVRPEIVKRARADLAATRLDWYDIEDGPSSLSLEGMVTTPYWSNETGEKGTRVVKDSLIVPCVVDTRWWPVDLHYDPRSSSTVQHSLGNLSALGTFWGAGSDETVLYKDKSISIDLAASWAAFIDHPVLSSDLQELVMTGPLGQNATTSGILDLLKRPLNFLDPEASEADDWEVFVPSFTSFGEDELDNVAGHIAVILSLVITDAIARQAVHRGLYVRQRQFTKGKVELIDMRLISDLLENTVPSDQKEVDRLPRIDWRVERYGWGYSVEPGTTRFGIAVLLVHAVILVAYMMCSLFYRRSKDEWHSEACGSLPHVITTAILSRPQHPETVELITTGRERDRANAQVRIRMYRHNPELIMGHAPDGGEPMDVDKQC